MSAFPMLMASAAGAGQMTFRWGRLQTPACFVRRARLGL
ncbi:hypothetical protein Ga0080574_TMP3469 [Salipiger abyssi]|uniref:Uncharacterized protein n=1 Tax=Salipiger abyssi TaxID=1250539 RepID=A0A1P8UWM6_9RHOB|nr:hypothetical protein Ga0080574_TMP3469 [Salipiger abyssi]